MQDSEHAIRTKAKQFCEKLMRFISQKDEESISTPMKELVSEELVNSGPISNNERDGIYISNSEYEK